MALAGALETAHRAGIIHRDVKPENVLFSAFGAAQLVDFGIARMASAFETRSGSISTTIAHAPPEVVAGQEATVCSDVYSLASVLFFAVSGEAPFSRPGETSLAPLIARIATADPPDLRQHGVPGPLAAALERALAKDPAARPSSAAAFGESLQDAADAIGLTAPTLVLPTITTAGAMPPAAAPPPAPAPPASPAPPTAEPALLAAGVPENVTATVDRDRSPRLPQPAPVAPQGNRNRKVLAAVAAGALVLAGTGVALGMSGRGGGAARAATAASSSDTTVTTAPDAGGATTSTTGTSVTTAPAPSETTVTAAPAATSSTGRATTTTTRAKSTTRSTTPGTTGTTAAPTTVTTGATTPTTQTPTTATQAPGTVPSFTVASPTGQNADGTGTYQNVRVTLSWAAPTDDGGSAITGYRVRCTLMMGSSVYTGSTTPAPCKGGAQIATAGASATSLNVTLSRVEPGPLTWIKWELAADNAAGTGAYRTATVKVPNIVGIKSWNVYSLVRVLGLAADTGRKNCAAATVDDVCDQTPSAGQTVANGSAMTIFFKS